MRLFLAVFLTLIIGTTSLAQDVKSVILLVGTGLGSVQLDLTRNYAGGTLNIDKLPEQGRLKTGSANSPVPDAAAAATALATGSRTNNGLLSMLPNGEKLQSVAQVMKNKGGKVGIVTTGLVTNPVCAAFYANSLNSTDEAALAEQALRSKIDLLVGGGRAAFRPVLFGGSRQDSRDLLLSAQIDGYTVAQTWKAMEKAEGPKLLGLPVNGVFSYEIDRGKEGEQSLADLTKKALAQFDSERFFLLVSGSRIGDACLQNDPAAMVLEILAFDQAVGVALEYAMRRPDVLVVVTSTYEAGGLLAATADIEYLKKINKSVEQMNRELAWDLSNLWDLLSFHAGFQELTIEEAQLLSTIESSNAPYILSTLLNNRAGLLWTSQGPTGSSVPVFAAGPAAEIIVQQQDQAGLGKALKQVIQ
jgi:alkaline phosphatase